LRISIPKWATFQHYKDRRPDWIKLYRTLLENRYWHGLSGDAAKLLVEIWLIASESKDGVIDVGTEEVAWRLRKHPDLVAAWLIELEQGGFVELAVQDAGTTVKPTDLSTDRQKVEPAESLYGNVHGPKSPVRIDIPEESRERVEKETEKEKPGSRVVYTQGQLLEAARKVCGLGCWTRDEENRAHSVLVTWCGTGRKPEEVWAAIHGSRMLVDAGKITWLERGKPYGLRALNNTGMLFDQGDGMAARPFFPVAVEAYYEHDDRPQQKGVRGGQPTPIGESVLEMAKRFGVSSA
jgi:hypothetical protein